MITKDIFRRTLRLDFIRQIVETFLTRFLLICVSTVTTIIVSRALGPEGRGFYALALTVGAIGVQFGCFGLHASNTYYVAKDNTLLPELLGNTLLISLLVGGLGACLAGLVFFVWPSLAPLQGSLLLLALLWIPLGLAYLLMQNLLLGVQEVRTFNKAEIFVKVLTLAGIVMLILTGGVSAEKAVGASLIALLIGTGLVFSKLYIRCGSAPHLSYPLLRNGVRYSLDAYVAAFFSYVMLKLDMLMIKYMLGTEQVGYYSIASSMADVVFALPSVVGMMIFPKLSSMLDRERQWKYTRRAAFSVGLTMAVVGCLAVELSGPAIKLLFGAIFIPAAEPFVWLMPGIFFLSIGTVMQNSLGASGRSREMIYGPMVAAVVNMAANMFFIRKYGILGAAYTSSIAYFLLALIGGWLRFRASVDDARASMSLRGVQTR